jgi:ribonuclease M5
MAAPRLKEVIVVEGRYDKGAVSRAVDATVFETSGFGIFSDRERLLLLRRLAEQQGLIVLSDSDGAGFVIRNYLRGALPRELVKHAYIPDLPGKERRKRVPGKEGKLGVEAMPPEVILEALRRAGATFLDEAEQTLPRRLITKTDFYQDGLSGQPESKEKRQKLCRILNLPQRLLANALLEALNILYGYDGYHIALSN